MYGTNELIFLGFALVGAIISSFAGFGSSLILLPVSATLIPVKNAIALVVVFFIVNNLAKLIAFRQHVNWRIARLQWTLGVPLAVVGAWFMTEAPNLLIERLLGLAVLVYVLNEWFGFIDASRVSDRHVIIAGGLNGFLGGLIGGASVIRVAVFRHLGLRKEEFIATLAISGLVFDLAKSAVYARSSLITLADVPLIIGLTFCAFIGTQLGKRFGKRIDGPAFKQIVLVLLALLGLQLLL